MSCEMLICIPGPWKDRSDFLRQVVALEPIGRFMFAGGILVDLHEKNHVLVDFAPADPDMEKAMEIAGQGKLSASTLAVIHQHLSVVYLHFPIPMQQQHELLVKFTKLLQSLGGMAVKVESAGIAHTWDRWFQLLGGSLFDLYCSSVVLIGGEDHYYSWGMHHFGLPECAVPTTIDLAGAAELMNRFNFWQIDEDPTVKSGQTFSLSEDEPRYRLDLRADDRHEKDEPFHNPQGVWFLSET